jgi:predicted dinucleotide-binding enzyme
MVTKIGILGSGMVAQSLGNGFLAAGHEVKLGTRDTAKLAEWLHAAGPKASVGSFEEAAKFGELLCVATKWEGTRNAISMAGKQNFAGKTVIDVTNPLEFGAEGTPPKLAFGYPDSAGAKVQALLPDAKVVKAFNTISANRMCNAKFEEGTGDLFICGNDAAAKKTVSDIAAGWGWSVSDIGGIEESYLLEALAMVWIRYGFLNNHWTHGFRLLKK